MTVIKKDSSSKTLKTIHSAERNKAVAETKLEIKPIFRDELINI